MSRKPTTYWDYIKVEELLALQTGTATSEEGLSNDEVLFITVHQIDELWFKLILRELVSARDLFAQEHVPDTAMAAAVRGLRRTQQLFSQVANHFELMETMTTRDYLAFRHKLDSASGFQSAQMREIEIIMGLKLTQRIALGSETYLQALQNPDGSSSPALHRVQQRLQQASPSLRDAIWEWLYRTPIEGSNPTSENDEQVIGNFIARYLQAHANELALISERAILQTQHPDDRMRLQQHCDNNIQEARSYLYAQDLPEADRKKHSRIRAAVLFIESYRELPLLAWPREVLDSIVALEQSFVIFRQRHARMVERMIGRRMGTGGSTGVDYLDQTALRYRIFNEVWTARTLLLPKRALPPISHEDFYGFADNPSSLY